MEKLKVVSSKELDYFSKSLKKCLKSSFKEVKKVSKHSDLEKFDDRRMRTSNILYYKDTGKPFDSHDYIDRLNLHVDIISNKWYPPECKAVGEDVAYKRLTFQPVSIYYFIEDYTSLETMVNVLHEKIELKKEILKFTRDEFQIDELLKHTKFYEYFVESLQDWYRRNTKFDFHYIDTSVQFRPLFDSIVLNAYIFFEKDFTLN